MTLNEDEFEPIIEILSKFEDMTEFGDAVSNLISASYTLIGINELGAAQTILRTTADLVGDYINFLVSDKDWDAYSELDDELVLFCTFKRKLTEEEFNDK